VTPEQAKQDPAPPLVLHVGSGRAITVNGATVGLEELPDRLRRMFAARDDHVLFFDAADDAEYGFTVEVMDLAREGGAATIAALTSALTNTAPAEPTAP
jgi:biopolymer transport protein ExbD/biopolymer transport protein TolR